MEESEERTWAPYYWKAHREKTNKSKTAGSVEVVVGLPRSCGSATWEFLCSHAALAAKLNLLLWHRVHFGGGKFGAEFITLNISEICTELGFSRLPGNRGHRPENRRVVYRTLQALMNIRVDALFEKAS